MATWTTPSTARASGYVPTAAVYKSDLVDNLRFLQYQGARLQTPVLHTYSPAQLNASQLTFGTLPLDLSAQSTWATDPAMNSGGVFVIPTGMGGWWHFDFWVTWEAYAPAFVNTQWAGVQLVQAGSLALTKWLKWQGVPLNATSQVIHSGSWSFFCAAGDTISLNVGQTSGSNKYVVGWLHGQWMSGGSGSRPAWVNLATPGVRSQATNTLWNNITGNLKFLHDRPFCHVSRTADQAHVTGTDQALFFTAADVYDASGMHNPAGASENITCPYMGLYLVDVRLEYLANADIDGRREILIKRWTDRGDGTYVLTGDTRFSSWVLSAGGMTPSSALYWYAVSGTALVPCRINDVIQAYAWQDSGSTLTIDNAEMQVTYLGGLRTSPYGDQLELAPGAGMIV